jgi:hypothetical protein
MRRPGWLTARQSGMSRLDGMKWRRRSVMSVAALVRLRSVRGRMQTRG